MARKPNKHIGSSFESFLEEEGMLEEVNAAATKSVFAWCLQQALESGLTKKELAKKLDTSRVQLDRLLDPDNQALSLQTMERIASVLNKRLVVSLEDKEGQGTEEGGRAILISSHHDINHRLVKQLVAEQPSQDNIYEVLASVTMELGPMASVFQGVKIASTNQEDPTFHVHG